MANPEIIHTAEGLLLHTKDNTIELTWPEVNKLQDDLRQRCVRAGITVRGHA